MREMPENLKNIEGMPWEELQSMAIKELSTIPVNEHVAFETLFRMKWPQFAQMISHLAGKSYDEISSVGEMMTMLGDLSGNEVMELTMIGTLNKSKYKSPKIEYYLICRHLHTKRR